MTESNPIPPSDPVPPPQPMGAGASIPFESMPLGTPTKDEINMGMLAHLLGLFTSIIGPLIIWLMKKDESKYIDEQAREALNFQIVALIATFCCFVGFCLAPILIAAVQVTRITFSIIASVKSAKGEIYRYPLTFRLIK